MCCWSVTTGPTDARPASDSVRSAMAADVFTNLFVARLLARRICRSIEQHVYKALGLRREDAPFAQHHAIGARRKKFARRNHFQFLMPGDANADDVRNAQAEF